MRGAGGLGGAVMVEMVIQREVYHTAVGVSKVSGDEARTRCCPREDCGDTRWFFSPFPPLSQSLILELNKAGSVWGT